MDWTLNTETLQHLWHAGWTSGQIAHEFGCTRNAVSGKINRLGLKRDRPKQSLKSPVVRKAVVRRRLSIDFETPLLTQEVSRLTPPLPPKILPDNAAEAVRALPPSQCRFPVGDPFERGFFFCEGIRVVGTSYCSFHLRNCLNKSTNNSGVSHGGT